MRYFILFVLVAFGAGCMSAGTHGYIKRYRYPISKYKLEKVVYNIIGNNAIIVQDSIKGYYNDDTMYITMYITPQEEYYEYTFHFYGGKSYWDTSKTSAISIVYAYNKNREGGSEGNGGVKKYEKKLIEELTEPFEREFISKIDSILSMKHKEE